MGFFKKIKDWFNEEKKEDAIKKTNEGLNEAEQEQKEFEKSKEEKKDEN